jgi:hypothetical protein
MGARGYGVEEGLDQIAGAISELVMQARGLDCISYLLISHIKTHLQSRA